MLREKAFIASWVMAIIISFCVVAWSEPNTQQTKAQSKSHKMTKQKGAEQITTPKNLITTEQLIDAISQAIEATANKAKTTQNLSSPDNSTYWFSFFLVIFTGGLVLVGGVQCYIIFKTLRETKVAANAAKASADALPAIERAYLFVKVILLPSGDTIDGEINTGTTDNPGANKVKIIITNHGKTPAILERVTIIKNSFFTEDFDLVPPFGTELIASGTDKNYNAHFFIHGDEEWEKINARKAQLICEGRLYYTDVWVITHDEIGFCWQYNELFGSFVPNREPNRNYRRQTK